MIVQDSALLDHRPPLGVVRLVNEVGRLFTGSFGPLVGVAVLLAILNESIQFGIGLHLARSGIDVMLRRSFAESTAPNAISLVSTALVVLFGLVLYAFTTNLLTIVADRHSAGRAVRAGDAVGTAFRYLPSAFAALIAVVFLFMLGFLALVVPGIWVAGVYSVASTVIVVERRWRGFLGRSRRLTKDYRWPLVGFFAIVYVIASVLAAIVGFLSLLLPTAAAGDVGWAYASTLVTAVANGLTAAILAAAALVAYRRLVEIKEGGGTAELRAVFE